MRKITMILGSSLLVLSLAACQGTDDIKDAGPGPEPKVEKVVKEKQPKPATPSAPANTGIAAGTMEPSLHLEGVKDGVARLNFELKNQTSNVVTLNYNNGLKFDFIVKDSQGKERFQFSKEMMTTQALVQDSVKQGELLAFLVETPKLEKGKYTIEVWSTSREFKEAKANVEFEVK